MLAGRGLVCPRGRIVPCPQEQNCIVPLEAASYSALSGRAGLVG